MFPFQPQNELLINRYPYVSGQKVYLDFVVKWGEVMDINQLRELWSAFIDDEDRARGSSITWDPKVTA